MNLSRAAKKFRAEMPQETEASKTSKANKKAARAPAAPQSAVQAVEPVVEPIPEPAATAPVSEPAPRPKKVRPEKVKRSRFVYVPQKAEQQERPAAAPLPPRSTKLTARLLTKNLALPPKDDAPKLPR